jgi:S-DNA-T family DNA segregation ATPase FtsK/SpoIIIE
MKTNSKKIEQGITGADARNHHLSYRAREVILVFVGALALFLLLALASYHETDSGWSYHSSNALLVKNSAGKIGAYSADMILSFLGFFGFLLPVLLAYGAWVLYCEPTSYASSKSKSHRGMFLVRFFGVFFVFLGGSGLSALLFDKIHFSLPQGAGGILGELALRFSLPVLNLEGSALVFTVLMLLGLTLYGGLRWIEVFVFFGRILMSVTQWFSSGVIRFFKHPPRLTSEFEVEREREPEFNLDKNSERNSERNFKNGSAPEVKNQNAKSKPSLLDRNFSSYEDKSQDKNQVGLDDQDLNFEDASDFGSPVKPSIESFEALKVKKDIKPMLTPDAKFNVTLPAKPQPIVESVLTASHEVNANSSMPSIDLLDLPQSKPQEVSEEFLRNLAHLTEEKLNDFGVDAKVVGALPGPVITRFELQLAAGVKAGKLTNLSRDLARSLSVHSVRIVEVIPGKSYVGLEIPNETRQTVRLREVLSSSAYREHPSPLAMGLGLNIQGIPEVVDLQKMPHLLVAGTTGSGKSVGLNAMLLSLLLKSTPEYLRLIMIDPKMLELSIYEGIPHLLAPVVTDMKEAANALRWCVKEMDRRYQLMAAMAVRNIGGYNEKVKAGIDAGTPLLNPLQPEGTQPRDPLACMPYIVVLVDEFADMIMVVGKKVEELIARLAQKARAAGIHLIVATQRPSVDVITGLIKANIPTRMAFQVSSKIDSRTILDQSGAEQLLGYGDMLYLPPGSGHPVRVHGAYVSDQEVQKIVEAWRQQGGAQYHPEVLKSLTEDEDGEKDGGGSSGSRDELFDEAVKIVLETQRASISAVQRRLRIGYNRAARLVEEMEEAGIVSELMPNGMREVLVSQ